ncbi:OmpA family protein [Thiothrix winogradskyi]|uniref:OmpA family protein n=1 Tax=Thiothrix winogradskyi TaxID=96472 RepID=A0ABY3SW86_9GAMM|nr:OmpA family protein [Thiothrix winogradskyi]UJS22751.1 OmpA family protein [Thiothrix winogradskyi]
MKAKSLIVLLLAGIWGVGSWWWYTCKVKGFCGADISSAQIAAGTAATGAAALSGSASDAAKNDKANADKVAADAQAKADADKAAADEKAKADADKAAADAQAKPDTDKAAADAQAKPGADKAAADEKAKADADKAAADEKAKADADKAAADEKAKADADKATADAQAKADADKAAAEAKADADKVTMETTSTNQNGDIGPATLTFPTGSANPQLAASTKAYFEKVAQFLKDNSNAKVTIVGHTDNKGDPAKNKALGLKRAEMLQKTLIDLGAPKDRVSAASEGADKPIADNNTEEGRKKNRRVEITPVK